MSKALMLGLGALAGVAWGQEGGPVAFDLNAATNCYSGEAVRWDYLLIGCASWRLIAWLAGRQASEPAVAIPTALTAVFVLAPFQASWFVNPPAMILLSLVGEATPWSAVAMVWSLSFGIVKGMEALNEKARLVALGIDRES